MISKPSQMMASAPTMPSKAGIDLGGAEEALHRVLVRVAGTVGLALCLIALCDVGHGRAFPPLSVDVTASAGAKDRNGTRQV